jgi:hypothetical protein
MSLKIFLNFLLNIPRNSHVYTMYKEPTLKKVALRGIWPIAQESKTAFKVEQS